MSVKENGRALSAGMRAGVEEPSSTSIELHDFQASKRLFLRWEFVMLMSWGILIHLQVFAFLRVRVQIVVGFFARWVGVWGWRPGGQRGSG